MLKQGNYVSTISVVERVFRDVDYAEQYVDYSDCLEYVWEVLEYLNIPMIYRDEDCEITISDYRGTLPSNFNTVIQVRDKNTLVPLIYNSNLAYKSPNKNPIDETEAHLNVEGGYVELSTEQQSSLYQGVNGYYKIEGFHIYTEDKDRTIELLYKAFPIDNNGFPMIPEDAKLIRAIKNYIIHMIDKKAWRRGEITDKVYQASEQDYLFSVGSVQTHAVMPDLNMMESMRRRSSLLVADTNNFNKSFKYLGG